MRASGHERLPWQIARLAPRPVVVLGAITGACLLGDSSLYVLLPANLAAFGVTPAAAGLILGVNRYVRLVSNSGAAWTLIRIGAAIPLAIAVMLAGATTLAYGLITGLWLLFIAHGLWGVCWSVLRLSSYLAAVETGSAGTVGRYMGVFQGVSRTGSLIAVVVGGLLADRLGIRDTYILFGMLTFAAVLLIPFARIPGSLGRGDTTSEPVESASTSLNSAWQIRTLYLLGFTTWLVVGGMTATVGYVMQLRAAGGVTIGGLILGVGTFTGLLLGVRWVTDLGFGPLFGHVSDRLGRRPIILGSLVIFVAAFCVLAVQPPLVVLASAFALVFFASSAMMLSLNAAVAEEAPTDRRAVVLGRYTTWTDIGAGTGPFLALAVAASAGYWVAYGAAAAIAALTGIIYWVSSTPRDSISGNIH